MPHDVHRLIARGRNLRIVEVVGGSDRVFDERRVRFYAVAGIDGETRRGERGSVYGAFARFGYGLCRFDVEAFEYVDELFRVLINGVVHVGLHGCLAVRDHQPVDEFAAALGRSHRNRPSVFACYEAAFVRKGEAEKRFVAHVGRGVEVEIERRIAVFREIVVARDFVDVEGLRSDRVASVCGDRKDDLRGVEDRTITEIPILDGVIAQILGHESRFGEAGGIVARRAEIARAEIGCADGIRLIETGLEEAFGRGQAQRPRAHLLIVGQEARTERVVGGRAAAQRCGGDRQRGPRTEDAAEPIESHHRNDCSLRKSLPPRAIGIRGGAFRCRVRFPTPRGRLLPKQRSHRRHSS